MSAAPGRPVSDTAAELEAALRRVLADPDVQRQFWRAGYEHLSDQAAAGAARWIGTRLMSGIGGALLAFGVWLGFRFGGWSS